MNDLQLFVPGIPRAKQSFIVVGHGRGAASPTVKAWQEQVGWHTRQLQPAPDPQSRYKVTLHFYTTKYRAGDCDNLSKAVLDALNGIIWKDDDQVDELHIFKQKEPTNPGVEITISPVPPQQSQSPKG